MTMFDLFCGRLANPQSAELTWCCGLEDGKHDAACLRVGSAKYFAVHTPQFWSIAVNQGCPVPGCERIFEFAEAYAASELARLQAEREGLYEDGIYKRENGVWSCLSHGNGPYTLWTDERALTDSPKGE